MTTYIFVFLAIFVYLLYQGFRWKYSYWKKKGVFYLQLEVIFGIVRSMIMLEKPASVQLKLMHSMIKEAKESFGGFYFVTCPVILIVDPILIKKVLVKDGKYFYDRHFHFVKYFPRISDNIVSYRGAKWKRIRTQLTPSFTPRKMMHVFQYVLESCVDLQEILERTFNMEQPVDFNNLMSRFVLDNISTSFFGYKSNCLKDSESDFYKYALLSEEYVFKHRVVWFAQIYPRLGQFLMFFSINFAKGVQRIEDYFTKLMAEAIDHREKNNIQKDDLLDTLIKSMKNRSVDDDNTGGLSFDELVTNAYSFYVGGYHTTENSLTFAFLELALNQEVQNTLRDEICQTLKKYDGKTTYDSIMEMTYLDQVLSETLRKYPILSTILRECTEDYKIEGTNVVIDKGTKVWVSIYGLHMDPEYYPDPEKFDPGRFSSEENKKRLPFTYLPFGEGHRICIGKRIALLQMKITLVEVLKLYRLTVDAKTVLPVDLEIENAVLTPRNKIWLNVTRIRDENDDH